MLIDEKLYSMIHHSSKIQHNENTYEIEIDIEKLTK